MLPSLPPQLTHEWDAPSIHVGGWWAIWPSQPHSYTVHCYQDLFITQPHVGFPRQSGGSLCFPDEIPSLHWDRINLIKPACPLDRAMVQDQFQCLNKKGKLDVPQSQNYGEGYTRILIMSDPYHTCQGCATMCTKWDHKKLSFLDIDHLCSRMSLCLISLLDHHEVVHQIEMLIFVDAPLSTTLSLNPNIKSETPRPHLSSSLLKESDASCQTKSPCPRIQHPPKIVSCNVHGFVHNCHREHMAFRTCSHTSHAQIQLNSPSFHRWCQLAQEGSPHPHMQSKHQKELALWVLHWVGWT